MDRLTFDGNFCDIAMCREQKCHYDGSCSQRKVWERLKAYEDTGLKPETCAEYKKFEDEAVSKGVTFKRIIELMEAEKDGLMMVLPIPIGQGKLAYGLTDPDIGPQHIATIVCDRVDSLEIWDNQSGEVVIEVDGFEIGKSDVGKTVFLTREEAEAALKGCGGE